MSSNIQRWVDENEKTTIVEEGKLRKVIRKALLANKYNFVEDNIDLIFTHLNQTNRLALGIITSS